MEAAGKEIPLEEIVISARGDILKREQMMPFKTEKQRSRPRKHDKFSFFLPRFYEGLPDK
jgi:hypothetical protein